MHLRTLSDGYLDTLQRCPDALALGARTWAELDRERLVIASGLMHLVLHPRAFVLIASPVDDAWCLLHLAAWSAGAIPAALDPGADARAIAEAARELSATHVVVRNAEDAALLPEAVRTVVVMRGGAQGRAITWAALRALGEQRLTHNDKDAYERFRAAGEETLAAIAASGAVLERYTHAQLVALAAAPEGLEVYPAAALVALAASMIGGSPIPIGDGASDRR